MVDRRQQVVELHLHLAGQQVGERQRGAPMGHVLNVDAGIILKSSPLTCVTEPVPAEPKLIFPGCALA
jgi:hypothetical protein